MPTTSLVHLLQWLEPNRPRIIPVTHRVNEGHDPTEAVDLMNRRKIATEVMDLLLRSWQKELRSYNAQALTNNYVTMTFVFLRNYSNGIDPWAGRFLGRMALSDVSMTQRIADEGRAKVVRSIMEDEYSLDKEQELLRNLHKLAVFVDGPEGQVRETFLFDDKHPQPIGVFPHKNTWLTQKECVEENPDGVEILQFSGASVEAIGRRLALAVQVACTMQANQGLQNEHCAKALVLVQDGGLRLGVQSYVCIRKSTITDGAHGFFSVEWAQHQAERRTVLDTHIDTDAGPDIVGLINCSAVVTAEVFRVGIDKPHFKSELSIEHIRRAMLMKLSSAGQSPKVHFGRFLMYQQFVYHLFLLHRFQGNWQLRTREEIRVKWCEIIEALTVLAFEDRDFRKRLLPRYDCMHDIVDIFFKRICSQGSS